ncbi:MAG TPA: hypothetical protein PKK96_05420 [Anaerolineales bacterium]|nr:hypothetical protein [Anaerolineales bacterium]HNS60424.1 hypothetical protein [Anaerolineales bacterium]
MKKVIPALVVLLVVGACLPAVPTPISPTATVIGSSSAPTLAPSNTISPSETPVIFNPSITPASASSTPESTATSSPLPNLTSTLATSTDVPATLAQSTATGAQLTSTPILGTPGAPSLTPTLGILKYGTLPPEVPFNRITLWNRSKAQAYISLQVTLPDGRYSIIEYPVAGMVKVKAPLGFYVYVAWVGGNKMTGTFRLTSTDSLMITLFKDKVVIK